MKYCTNLLKNEKIFNNYKTNLTRYVWKTSYPKEEHVKFTCLTHSVKYVHFNDFILC